MNIHKNASMTPKGGRAYLVREIDRIGLKAAEKLDFYQPFNGISLPSFHRPYPCVVGPP